jgi:hypothetical protein
MDRIMVAGDLHISLAVRAWLEPYGLEVTVADGGVTGIFALDDSTFDLMHRRYIHAAYPRPAQILHAGNADDRNQRMSGASSVACR